MPRASRDPSPTSPSSEGHVSPQASEALRAPPSSSPSPRASSVSHLLLGHGSASRVSAVVQSTVFLLFLFSFCFCFYLLFSIFLSLVRLFCFSPFSTDLVCISPSLFSFLLLFSCVISALFLSFTYLPPLRFSAFPFNHSFLHFPIPFCSSFRFFFIFPLISLPLLPPPPFGIHVCIRSIMCFSATAKEKSSLWAPVHP